MMPARTVLTCAPRRLRVVTRYLGTQVKDKLPLKSRSPAALGRALDAVARGAPPWRPSRPAGPAARCPPRGAPPNQQNLSRD